MRFIDQVIPEVLIGLSKTRSPTEGQLPKVNPGIVQSIPMDNASQALGYSVWPFMQTGPSISWQLPESTAGPGCRLAGH